MGQLCANLASHVRRLDYGARQARITLGDGLKGTSDVGTLKNDDASSGAKADRNGQVEKMAAASVAGCVIFFCYGNNHQKSMECEEDHSNQK